MYIIIISSNTQSGSLSPFRSKWHYIGAPFAPSIIPSSVMFVASRSNKLLVSAGHWDNSFRVELLEKGKIVARVAYHQGEGAWCFTGGRVRVRRDWRWKGQV